MSKYFTYSEWSKRLELFIEGNDDILGELKEAQFEIDSGTAGIYYKKIESVYDIRKKQWLDKFNKTITETKPKTDGELEFIFRNARSNLNPIISFINLTGIPKDLKDLLKNDLILFVKDIKQKMKENIMKSNFVNERLLLIINNFNLSEGVFEEETEKSDIHNYSTTRKIIF